MQGCFMHFKGWEAARFQRLELQIVGLSGSFAAPHGFFGIFFFSISMKSFPLWDPYGQHTIKQAK